MVTVDVLVPYLSRFPEIPSLLKIDPRREFGITRCEEDVVMLKTVLVQNCKIGFHTFVDNLMKGRRS